MVNERYLLSGVGRALAFLELFADIGHGLTLTQATERAGIDQTAAFRIARTLEHEGYLTRDEHGVYKLGPTVLRLGVAYLDSLDLRSMALPRLGALLVGEIETASLATLSGRRAVVIERLERDPVAAVPGHVGWSFSLHATSLGKILLAHLPTETAYEWLSAAPLPRFTAATLVDPTELLTELERVRADGCAYNIEESRPRIATVAAPVYNHLGHVVAALNAGGTAPHVTPQTLRGPIRRAVLEAANALSYDLGFRESRREPNALT